MLRGEDGTFLEHDLDDGGRLAPVDRRAGQNRAGVVVGVVRTPTERYPEGLKRVAVLGDATKAMGSISEAECLRLLAAIDLAERLQVPLEWFALSAGAKIAMDSGSKNLDWVAQVLRRLVEHTQRGGEVNVVVAGINVGAQPYWNAEATMLMHTKGILVMTPDSAMVLTGKQAIDYSGGVSAEDNFGRGLRGGSWAERRSPVLGAYPRRGSRHPHGPLRPDVPGAGRALATPPVTHIRPTVTSGPRAPSRGRRLHDGRRHLLRHHQPGPQEAVRHPHPDGAVIDQDHHPLERWPRWPRRRWPWCTTPPRRDGGDADRHGVAADPRRLTPADGPGGVWAGTLFPLSSKKVARAINAASGCRPVVMLANLSGFDGSPESLRRLQLEYGAEIGRAIVNFDGPVVLCVVSRDHGGAFVVFRRSSTTTWRCSRSRAPSCQ